MQWGQLLGLRWRRTRRRRPNRSRVAETLGAAILGVVEEAQVELLAGIEGHLGVYLVRGRRTAQVTAQRLVYLKHVHFTTQKVTVSAKSGAMVGEFWRVFGVSFILLSLSRFLSKY